MTVLRLNLASLFLIILNLSAFSQNKTLGVGTTVPNPNAALHVESPTNNQGMILPRLTTAQRTAMVLTASDDGLLVYDTDLKGVFTWDGTGWSTSGEALPASIVLSNADLIADPYALSIEYTGDEAKTLLNIDFSNAANPNITNPFRLTHAGQGAAMTLTQSGTLGTGAIFQLTNATNPQQAFRALTVGTGTGGLFTVNNTASGGTALIGTTNTDLGGPLPPVGVYGEATGTGASAGSFRISNSGNPYSALFTETDGTGIAVNANIINATSTSPVIYANHAGNGFGVHAVANTTAFGGAAVYGEQFGTGDAAGAFRINNAGSNYAALYGETNGTSAGSSAVRGLNLGGGNGAYFRKNGATVNSAAMWADNFGADGYGAIIQNTDPLNPTAALFAEAVGTGPSVWANKDVGESGSAINASHSGSSGNSIDAINTGSGFALFARASGVADAIYAVKEAGDGTGSAGNFWNNEPGNAGSALFAASNAAAGSAVGAINSAEGNAVSVFQGGFKMSTHQASGGGAITVRAMAYTVDSNTYTFSFPISEGESFYVFNIGGSNATVEGASLSASEGRVFIMIGGVLRPF